MSTYCKYYKVQNQISYDNGVTWVNIGIPHQGELAEFGSESCGYTPGGFHIDGKYLIVFDDGTTRSGACNSSSALTGSDLWSTIGGDERTRENAIAVFIGDCVNELGVLSLARTKITSISIPSGVTTIGGSAFEESSELASVKIPNTVTSIGDYLFLLSPKLKSATISNAITEIPQGTFWHCSGLTSVTMSNNVTKIGNVAFEYCSSLTSLPNISNVTEIEQQAFGYCSGLTGNLDIPNSVQKIGRSAFYDCTGISAVTIGTGIREIGSSAFFSSKPNITSVTIKATTPPSVDNSSLPSIYPLCPIYVPRNSVSTYKSAPSWSSFVDRIYPIPT